LYGTTYTGGANDCGVNSAYLCGTVFVLTHSAGSSWKKTVLYSFNGTDGAGPRASLVFDSTGTFYGTTETEGTGGGLNGGGTVFALMPPATARSETTIYNFTALNGDGAFPSAGLVMDQNGVLYGATQAGGTAAGSPCEFCGIFGCGTIFSLTPPTTPGGPWTETILHALPG
jgi:hypothetical protein